MVGLSGTLQQAGWLGPFGEISTYCTFELSGRSLVQMLLLLSRILLIDSE